MSMKADLHCDVNEGQVAVMCVPLLLTSSSCFHETSVFLRETLSISSQPLSNTSNCFPSLRRGCREVSNQATLTPTSGWKRTFCWRIRRCKMASTGWSWQLVTVPSKTAQSCTAFRTRRSTVFSTLKGAFLGFRGTVGEDRSCFPLENHLEWSRRDRNIWKDFHEELSLLRNAPKLRYRRTPETKEAQSINISKSALQLSWYTLVLS